MSMTIETVCLEGEWITPTSVEADGVRVKLRPLTAGEYSRIMTASVRDAIKAESNGDNADDRGKAIVRAAFQAAVLDTEGITLKIGVEAARKPRDGADLFDALHGSAIGRSGLLDEIYAAIITGSTVSGETLGNWNAPRNSSTPATTKAGAPKSGVATTAGERGTSSTNSTETN